MDAASRYRSITAQCLLAAHRTSQLSHRKLHLLIPNAIFLLRQGEPMDDLVAILDAAAPVCKLVLQTA